MQIETISIDKLTPYENNAKEHPASQIEQIKESIRQYGNNDPIAVWGEDNIIVEGHGRYIALKELGETEVEIIRLDHLTDEERKEYTLVHNKLTMNTDFDPKRLKEELMTLDVDLSNFSLQIEDDEPIERKEVEKPEIPFTQVLGEENNYIVLKFTDSVDWLQVQTLFGLEIVKAYSTRKDGKITKGMERCGVGRVVDGVEFLNKIGVGI